MMIIKKAFEHKIRSRSPQLSPLSHPRVQWQCLGFSVTIENMIFFFYESFNVIVAILDQSWKLIVTESVILRKTWGTTDLKPASPLLLSLFEKESLPGCESPEHSWWWKQALIMAATIIMTPTPIILTKTTNIMANTIIMITKTIIMITMMKQGIKIGT